MEGIKPKLMCVDYRRAGFSPCVRRGRAGRRTQRAPRGRPVVEAGLDQRGRVGQNARRGIEQAPDGRICEPVHVEASPWLDGDEPTLQQAAEVVRGARRGQPYEAGDLSGRQWSPAQLVQDGQPRRIGEAAVKFRFDLE